MNEVKLIGTIVLNKDVEKVILTDCKNGNKLARFKLACGNESGSVAFVECEAWGELANRLEGKKKGERVKLIGFIKTPKSYEKNGKKVYPSNVITASNLAVVDNTSGAPSEKNLDF